MQLRIYTDGLCEPNPGVGTWAFIVFNDEGDEVHHDSGVIPGQSTNNVAEYYGVGKALKWAIENHPYTEITLISDSQLVINQILGQWACNSPKLQPLRARCAEYLNELILQFEWVKSEDNRADQLTRDAYFQKFGNYPPVYRKAFKK